MKQREQVKVSLLTTRELCEYLNISDSALRGLIRNKKIPYIRVGKLMRFDKKRIDSWLKTHTIEGNRFLSAGELGEYLGVSESVLRNMANRKQIPHVKIGRTVRFDKEDIEKWIKERKTEVRKKIGHFECED